MIIDFFPSPHFAELPIGGEGGSKMAKRREEHAHPWLMMGLVVGLLSGLLEGSVLTEGGVMASYSHGSTAQLGFFEDPSTNTAMSITDEYTDVLGEAAPKTPLTTVNSETVTQMIVCKKMSGWGYTGQVRTMKGKCLASAEGQAVLSIVECANDDNMWLYSAATGLLQSSVGRRCLTATAKGAVLMDVCDEKNKHQKWAYIATAGPELSAPNLSTKALALAKAEPLSGMFTMAGKCLDSGFESKNDVRMNTCAEVAKKQHGWQLKPAGDSVAMLSIKKEKYDKSLLQSLGDTLTDAVAANEMVICIKTGRWKYSGNIVSVAKNRGKEQCLSSINKAIGVEACSDAKEQGWYYSANVGLLASKDSKKCVQVGLQNSVSYFEKCNSKNKQQHWIFTPSAGPEIKEPFSHKDKSLVGEFKSRSSGLCLDIHKDGRLKMSKCNMLGPTQAWKIIGGSDTTAMLPINDADTEPKPASIPQMYSPPSDVALLDAGDSDIF